MLTAKTGDLWTLVKGTPQVDPSDLADAVCEMSAQDELDYRTRLLIRDSVQALQRFWGKSRVDDWLGECPHRHRIVAICAEEFERPGFPSLAERLMDKTEPAAIRRFLSELGAHVIGPAPLPIAGAAALILAGQLSRRTENVHVVGGIPAGIGIGGVALTEISRRYGLSLVNLDERSLPTNWETRLQPLGSFGGLRVSTVDLLDIFAGKLFSNRTKDLDDLRMLTRELDKSDIGRWVKESTQALQADPALRAQAERNWYILYGESLPT